MLRKENISTVIEIGQSSVRIYIDEDSILHIIAKGNIEEEIALKVRDVILSILKSQDSQVNELIDLNDVGKNSPEARDIWKELGELEQTGKVALVGLHPVARIMAAFVTTRIKGKKNMRFFSHREEALEWLKS